LAKWFLFFAETMLKKEYDEKQGQPE